MRIPPPKDYKFEREMEWRAFRRKLAADIFTSLVANWRVGTHDRECATRAISAAVFFVNELRNLEEQE